MDRRLRELQEKRRKYIFKRMNVLFIFIFVLFIALMVRLVFVQVVNSEFYLGEVNKSNDVIVKKPVPRGEIYDRNGKIVVNNEGVLAITYTQQKYERQTVRLEKAKELAKLIDMPTTKVTERDKKDFWLLTRRDEAKSLISPEELKTMKDEEVYPEQLKRITEHHLNQLSENELEILAIKREMDRGYALTPQIIKNQHVTHEEIAKINQHIEKLPGIETYIDWKRQYMYGSTFKPLLGSVTTSEQGLPSEKLDYYLDLGYSRNDRVGTSYIEEQYENYLQGKKRELIYVIDKEGRVKEERLLEKGEKGKDIVLTIDFDLQQEVEKIIEEELLLAKKIKGNELLDRAFVVMMNPKTGEILSMAGKQYVINEDEKTKKEKPYFIYDYSYGVIATQYEMGSTVKGATILSGLHEEAIKHGEIMLDAPIKIAGTPIKKSYQNMGKIDDLTALQRSSNVYMFKTVMKMAGVDYVEGGGLSISDERFENLRNYFRDFGLGVKTGIDLPSESTGLKGDQTLGGLYLDISIGQYDTYTPLQITQYISTIANNGKRMAPRLVKEIREPSQSEDKLGSVIKTIKPEILNTIPMEQKHIDRVKEGLRRVTQERGGTAYGYFENVEYFPAAKTGTADTYYYGPLKEKWGKSITNLTIVGYAPHDNPEIAFGIVVPWATSKYPINKFIARKILDAYFSQEEEKSASGLIKANRRIDVEPNAIQNIREEIMAEITEEATEENLPDINQIEFIDDPELNIRGGN